MLNTLVILVLRQTCYMMATNRGFIRATNFTEQAQITREESRVYKWNELTHGEIFKITDIEETEGKYGISYIASIVNDKGEKKRAWLPRRLAGHYNDNKTKTVYFTSLGQIFENQKRINDFDYVIQE